MERRCRCPYRDQILTVPFSLIFSVTLPHLLSLLFMTTTAETKLHVRMTPGKWKVSATCFRNTIVAVGSIAAVLCCAEPSPAADGVLEGTVNDVDVVDRDGQVVANAAGGGALGVDGGLRTGEAGRAQLDMDGHTVRVGEQTQACSSSFSH